MAIQMVVRDVPPFIGGDSLSGGGGNLLGWALFRAAGAEGSARVESLMLWALP